MILNPTAFSLTPKMKDCGHKPFKCALCDKTSRFAFYGVSRKSDSNVNVLVGVDCAKRLHNPMADSLRVESGIWISDNKSALINKAKRNRLVSVLIGLSKKEPAIGFERMIDDAKSGRPISPAQASLIMGLSQKYDISISTDLIKVSLRRVKERDQVRSMDEWKVVRLLNCLSPRQSRLVHKLRNND